jgi:TonB family protein
MSLLSAGRLAGEYVLQRELGPGPFAESFVASRVCDGRLVLLKRVNPPLLANRRLVERLRAQAISPPRIDQPGITELLSILFEGDDCWLVYEYVEGECAPRSGTIPVEAYCKLLEAVASAHRGGHIHAHIQPMNLCLAPTGALWLLDFACSRVFGLSRPVRDLLGKAPYRAPELAGEGDLDARVDVFSLGIVLREVVQSTAAAHGLRGVIARATAPAPSDRYRNASELLAAIRDWQIHQQPPAPAAAPPPSTPGPAADVAAAASKRSLPRAVWIAAAAIALAAAVGGLKETDVEPGGAVLGHEAPAAPVSSPEIRDAPPKPERIEPTPVQREAAPDPAPAPPANAPGRTFVWRQSTPRPAAANVDTALPGPPSIGPGGNVAAPPPVMQAPLVSAPPPPPPDAAPVETAPPPPAPIPDTPAVLLRSTAPRYPALARQSRVEGTVRLQVTVGADGRVTGVKPVHGHALLVDAAAESVRTWRYRPAVRGGRPAETTLQVDVTFSAPGRK